MSINNLSKNSLSSINLLTSLLPAAAAAAVADTLPLAT